MRHFVAFLCLFRAAGDTSVEFGGITLRVTTEEPPRVAVRDAVSLICRVKPARAARMRIDDDLKPFVGVHEFGGSRWHQTPVIAVNQLFRLVESLPPQCSGEFLSSGQWDKLRLQWGTQWASPASSDEPPPPPPPPLHMLAGGRCIDPETRLDEVCDLCFEWATGRISTVAPWSGLPSHATPATVCGASTDDEVVVHSVRGLVVSPGFLAIATPEVYLEGISLLKLGITSVVEALPGAIDVENWHAERAAAGAETNFGTAASAAALDLAALTPATGAGVNLSTAMEKLRRSLDAGATGIALDLSRAVPLSHSVTLRAFQIAAAAKAVLFIRGRSGTKFATPTTRLAAMQEIAADTLASWARVYCVDPSCIPSLQQEIEGDGRTQAENGSTRVVDAVEVDVKLGMMNATEVLAENVVVEPDAGDMDATWLEAEVAAEKQVPQQPAEAAGVAQILSALRAVGLDVLVEDDSSRGWARLHAIVKKAERDRLAASNGARDVPVAVLRAELLAAVEAVTLRPAQSLGLTAKVFVHYVLVHIDSTCVANHLWTFRVVWRAAQMRI